MRKGGGGAKWGEVGRWGGMGEGSKRGFYFDRFITIIF
jgi:hypothetical protein